MHLLLDIDIDEIYVILADYLLQMVEYNATVASRYALKDKAGLRGLCWGVQAYSCLRAPHSLLQAAWGIF